MQFITGINRQQVIIQSLDDYISKENPIRFIDAFVEKLDLQQLQFQVAVLNKEGRPAYESKLFLKIYLYGYLNGIRSSRRFEKECSRNIELQWLTHNLQPNYHSIADFRKNIPTALRYVFKLFVLFLKDMITAITMVTNIQRDREMLTTRIDI
jgi:transposase